MKQSQKFAICLAGGLVLSASARAAATDSQGNPYQGIAERNVFALKPAPRPEDNPAPAPPPPPIEVQGITSIFGHLQVMFSTTSPGSKPGQPGEKRSMVLGVGQRDGDIEVLEINEKARTVQFDNPGTPEIKDLAKDSPKPPSGPVPTPIAGSAKPAIPGTPVAGEWNHAVERHGGVITFGSAGSTLRDIPNRPTRGPMVLGGGMAAPAAVPAAATAQLPPLSAEEQGAMLLLQKAQDTSLPPPPPILEE